MRRLFEHLTGRRGRRTAAGMIPRQFRRDGVIFIHVPKCAGSAFLDAYLGWQTGHPTADEYRRADPTFFDSAYVFTFVRHPLARFVSAYHHLSTDDLWPQLAHAREVLAAHGGSLGEVAATLRPDSDLLRLPWFAPQHTFLEVAGRLAVNRVFKTETFAVDLEVLGREMPLRLRPVAEINRRGSGEAAPEAGLSADAIAALRRVYWRDLTLFGYY